jgi:hypothetical protein
VAFNAANVSNADLVLAGAVSAIDHSVFAWVVTVGSTARLLTNSPRCTD